jgi:hypothetical protein
MILNLKIPHFVYASPSMGYYIMVTMLSQVKMLLLVLLLTCTYSAHASCTLSKQPRHLIKAIFFEFKHFLPLMYISIMIKSVPGTHRSSITRTIRHIPAKHVSDEINAACPGLYYGNDLTKACTTSKVIQ